MPDAGPVFVALSDQTRRSIVEQLGTQPATASDLAGFVPVSRQAVVKHLAVLEDAGLVRGTRDGRRVVYELTPEPFEDAAALDVGGRRGVGRSSGHARARSRAQLTGRPAREYGAARIGNGGRTMGFRVEVDYDKCESNALCMAAAPEVFEVRDDDFLYVLDEHPPEALREKCLEAARVCPKQAITIVDE